LAMSIFIFWMLLRTRDSMLSAYRRLRAVL